MARINFINPSQKTRNYHYNYLYDYRELVKVLNDRSGTAHERYKDTAQAIQQQIITPCKRADRRARFIGAKWSLSEAPYCRDYIIDVSSLNLVLPLAPPDLHPDCQDDVSDICFVQAGKKIKSITKHLENRGKSLKTSGASNGQTISGAISTGVHGSAIDVGSIQDYVVGLHVIISDNETVYIERATDPVLGDDFAQKINARMIRDDALFNAALVSMGAFGFIYGVALRVEDIFLLERHILKLPREQALPLARTLDLAASPLLPHPGERPYHYKLYMNPFKNADPFIVEVLYKRPYGPYESPIDTIRSSYFGDLPQLIGKIVSHLGGSVSKFADVLSGTVFPSPTDPVKTGTLGDIFYDTTSTGSVFGMAVGVQGDHCEQVLDVMQQLVVDNKVPGMLSIRLVKGSKATLGFTRFDHTAIVEVDGVQWNKLNQFLELLTTKLKAGGLEFGLHWGKNADWSPALVDRMYGERKNQWLQQRDALLSPAMKKVFANKFLDDLGLS